MGHGPWDMGHVCELSFEVLGCYCERRVRAIATIGWLPDAIRNSGAWLAEPGRIPDR